MVNTPQDDDAEPVILEHDDQDTVAATRPLPEAEPTEQQRTAPEALPTIGHVGRYALKYCIGEGGLGTVYAAHDPLLSRLIAIKTMQVSLPEQDREQFNALFLNEAKAAGSLSHPHIVTVYDAGAGAQGTYIAMELLRGKDLRQLLAIGWRPTPGQAALIVRRVADALSYAHHKGVIHRDVKPANIFMVGRTQPRVLDFGIARIRQVESQVSDGMSRFGELVGGSPHYMAPEQVRREPVDRRADVYSLGVVLYELLTGRKPFGGSDLDEITTEVLTKALRPPHELNPEVPQALSEIAMRAMARDLVQRTRSARTLSQELREWLDGQADAGVATVGKSGKAEPKASRQAAQPSVASSGAGSRTVILAGAGAVAAALLVGIAWVGWGQVSKGPVKPASDVSAASQAQPVVARPAVVAPVVVPPVAAAASVAQPAGGAAPLAVLQQAPAAAVPAPVSQAPAPVQPPATVAPVAVAAKPVPTGTVRLAISPWGRVFVGRRAMGVTPPLTQFSLPQGQHTITVRNDDFPAYTQTVDVKAGQSVTVTHSF
ncbi:MAG TPA: serine/threonine-protein kinase [Aquabacterium sp.]|uniref:serine/threonine-protein kinase n=1 Tax=Aquabacterium sp. TaxID=1872578 RepID=UPI002E32BCD6|nr:serine/threonine-protein kinase [Aquabacterium sp.]HEX5371775.1 serine/threonine-protein kinase [Aquabacterium sp.]